VSEQDIHRIFDDGGLLSQHLPDYHARAGQVELALRIFHALAERHHAVLEGPTGSGKSFAELVPLVLLLGTDTGGIAPVEREEGDEGEEDEEEKGTVDARHRAVICTASIPLQEQLVRKDLPFLQQVLPQKFTFALLKGRGNYLCRHKLHEEAEKPTSELKRLQEWALETETGDQSDMSWVYEDWHKVSSTGDECLGKACVYRKGCFSQRARVKAYRANIVVSNYHLRLVGDQMMPDHSMLICDEAHALPDIARSALGFSISLPTLLRIGNWLLHQKSDAAARDVGAELNRAAIEFFNQLGQLAGKIPAYPATEPGWLDSDQVCQALDQAEEACLQVQRAPAGELDPVKLKQMEKRAAQHATRAATLAAQLEAADQMRWKDDDDQEEEEDNHVFWLAYDKARERVTVEGRPLVVGRLLEKLLYPDRVVVALSATMTVGGSFAYIRSELGVPKAASEFAAESPFDYQNHGAIVVPEDIVEPASGFYPDLQRLWVNDVIASAKQLILACGGRTLLLFTSWLVLDQVYRALSADPELRGLTLLKQGDAPRMQLVQRFRDEECSVLFGTDSFRTGIDVPGPALTGLLLDKIPFPVPTDPINKAMEKWLQQHGKNGFAHRALPLAILSLEQALGRGLRRDTDVLLTVITDTRLISKGYGGTIMRALPNFRKYRSMERGIQFLEDTGYLKGR